MPDRRLRRLAGYAIEAGVAIGLILALFVGLQGVLSILLPSDSGISGLLAGMRTGDEAAANSRSGRSFHSAGFGTDEPVAALTRIQSDVKTRRGTSVMWGNARRGMKLHNLDAIQTMDRSAASITFLNQGRLDLGSNTHIIIRSNDSDIFSTDRRSSLLMVDGELRGRLVSSTGKPIQFEVELPGGSTEIATSGEGEAAFRIRVNEDSTVAVVVDEGSARVMSQGDTVTVRSSQFTTIGSTSSPAKPETLADPVRVVGPAPGKVFDFRNVSPEVDFEWTAGPSFSGYRVLIARDDRFGEVIYDEVLSGSRMTHGNLETGTYYWRVYGIKDGLEVTVQDTRVFHLTRSVDPPPLTVWFPSKVVKSAVYVLKGKTEPGTKVVIGGAEVKVDARGYFMRRLQLDPGLNVIVVEAVDKLGNVAYESKVINSKP
jgi:hypothetical protein